MMILVVAVAVTIAVVRSASHLDRIDHSANQSVLALPQNFAWAEIVDSLRFPRFKRFCPSILTEFYC